MYGPPPYEVWAQLKSVLGPRTIYASPNLRPATSRPFELSIGLKSATYLPACRVLVHKMRLEMSRGFYVQHSAS